MTLIHLAIFSFALLTTATGNATTQVVALSRALAAFQPLSFKCVLYLSSTQDLSGLMAQLSNLPASGWDGAHSFLNAS